MSTRQSPATTRAMRLVEQKGLTLREAAQRCGIALSTLVRARKRAQAPALPLGRRPKT